MTEGDRPASASSITLHSSWRGLIGGLAGAGIVLLIATIALLRGGWRPVPIVVALIGAVLLAIVVLDFPVSTTFDEQGAVRRPLGRRHRIGYDQMTQLTRARPKIFGRVRTGGLVAAVGRRRYLLVDQAECRDEFHTLHELLERAAPGLADLDLSPPAAANPTWIYRRKRWGGSSARR